MTQEKGQRKYGVTSRHKKNSTAIFRKRWIRVRAEHNRLRQQTKLRFTLRRLFSMKTRLLTMSASIDKKIQVLFYLILRSAPKQVVQAHRAARCKPRRIHDSQHKKRHRIAMSFFWWEEVDSNHRRRCQQIYSLLPLATRESSHAWSWWSESNQQPADYKSAALPLSHTSEVFGTKTLCRTIRIKMVPWGGVEPPTQGFSVPCSTN